MVQIWRNPTFIEQREREGDRAEGREGREGRRRGRGRGREGEMTM